MLRGGGRLPFLEADEGKGGDGCVIMLGGEAADSDSGRPGQFTGANDEVSPSSPASTLKNLPRIGADG
jgi:hypothetical protein